MSIQLMTQVWGLELPAAEKLVLLALADHANDDGYCYPSQSSLARRCGVSERQIRRTITRLAGRGFLDVETSYRNDGGRSANSYWLTISKSSKSAAADDTPPDIDVQGPPDMDDRYPRTLVSYPPGHGRPGPPGHGCPPNHHIEPSVEPSDEPRGERHPNQRADAKAPPPRAHRRPVQRTEKPADPEPVLPANLNPEAWSLFDQHRNSTAKLRANWTPVAKSRAIAQLITLSPEDQMRVVDYSITGGYPGLYLDRVGNHSSKSSGRPKGAITRALEAFDAAERNAQANGESWFDSDDRQTPRIGAERRRIADGG